MRGAVQDLDVALVRFFLDDERYGDGLKRRDAGRRGRGRPGGLALREGDIGLDAAWTAAHVDEDWNMEVWGRDELALKRRAYRFAEATAAALVLAQMR